MNGNYLDSFLEFYNKQTNPGYAVLVTGDWGAGKTTYVKKKLTDDGMYYVSLFGLTTPEEIYSAVFLKMFPLKGKSKALSKKAANASIGTESYLFGIPGLLNGLVEAVIKNDVKNDKIIVFDDLERTSIKINDILGVINQYVEHHKCKVVAIAHDEKIEASFSETKEKVFGQTLKFTPAIREVFQLFVNESQNPAAIDADIKKHIIETFEASGCNSLRVLRHTLSDCLRLLTCLDREHINNKPAMVELFTLFTALTIGFRTGKIKTQDLRNRLESSIIYSMSKKVETDITSLISFKNKFESCNFPINFESNILSDEILEDIISNGYINKTKIIECINSNYFFAKREDLKPWEKLINFEEMDDIHVNKTIQEINSQISKNELTDLGDICHVYNLKFLMSYSKEIPLSYDDVLTEAKNYIDSLVRLKLFPIARDKLAYQFYNSNSAHGYGFWILDEYKNHSKELTDYIEKQTITAQKNEYPNYKTEILDSLQNDISSFSLMISRNHNENGKYAYIDVLSSIDINNFVDIWLSLPRSEWDKVRAALKARYDSGLLRNVLVSENQWIKDVITELHRRAANENGLKKFRIERLVPSLPTYE